MPLPGTDVVSLDKSRNLHSVALMQQRQGDLAGALATLAEALALDPRNATLHNNAGVVLRQLGQLGESLECFLTAMDIEPNYVDAWLNAGATLNLQGQLEHAAKAFQRALQLQPQNAAVHVGLGNTFARAGQPREAVGCYETALLLQPDHLEARWGRGLANLQQGLWQQGWADYELRFSMQQAYPHDYAKPRWSGETFVWKTLLVHDEIGYGDVFQFSRFLPLLKARGGKVMLEVKPGLERLFAGFPGMDEIRVRSQRPQPGQDFDLYVPLESLPGIFDVRPERVPPPVVPVIDPQLLQKWQNRFAELSGQKVGLVWSGNPDSAYDQTRSLPAGLLETLVDACPAHSFVSLQVGRAAAVRPSERVLDASEELHDFAETAAAIMALDRVIAVETAVAHLAGMLGKPVWVMLAHVPAWRWGLTGENSVWYPSMRLFRQTQSGDWQGVVQRVTAALQGQS